MKKYAVHNHDWTGVKTTARRGDAFFIAGIDAAHWSNRDAFENTQKMSKRDPMALPPLPPLKNEAKK